MDYAELDARREAYLRDQVRPAIAERGWVVQGVASLADDPDPSAPFAYTIGLTEAGLSELLISGLPHELLAPIVNAAAAKHIEHELEAPGTLNDVVSRSLRVIDAPHASVGVARALYGSRVRVLQLLWPDDTGAYPDEPGWSLPAQIQPLYNVRQL